MRRFLGPLYFNGVFWYRFHCWVAGSLPEPALRLLTRVFTTFCFLVLTGVRRSLRKNHGLVDPQAGWWKRSWRAYCTLHEFAWCLTERYQQFHPSAPLEMGFEGLEHWEAARAGGRGAIVVTSHIGGWEIGSAVPSAREEHTVVHVVREREADPEAQAFTEELLGKHSGASYRTHFADGEQDLSLELYAALRDGEVVALQGDRPRQGGKVVRARFFDQVVSLPPGPAQLARLSGAPLLPVFTFREGRSAYRMVFSEPIQVARTRDRQADVDSAVQRLASVIEASIRSHPDQWFCFNSIVNYEGVAPESKKVLSSPSATASPESLETSNR